MVLWARPPALSSYNDRYKWERERERERGVKKYKVAPIFQTIVWKMWNRGVRSFTCSFAGWQLVKMGSAGTAVCTIMIMITVSLVGVFSAAIEGNSLAHGGSQNWPQHSQLTKRNAVQLCGSRLVEAVKGICRGHIFSGYNRRSDSSNLGKSLFPLSNTLSWL